MTDRTAPSTARGDAPSAWGACAAWWSRPHTTRLESLAWVAAGTWLSWWMTGHVFGRSNNVFHLPVVAGLAQRPGFESDAFVQSLSGFASGLWMLLQGSDALWPAPTLFAFGLAATKALTLGGALAVARVLGLDGRLPTAAFVAVLATTPLLQGAAYAGHGGLFVDYFSHSELATAAMLWMWAALLAGRFGLAVALLGAVAFLNAFMAVWSLLPGAVVAAAAWRERGLGSTRSLLAGATVAALLVAPVAWRVIAATPAVPAVDLRPFVKDYFPYHFLATEMPAGQWLGLAAVFAAALLGTRWLEAARPGSATRDLQRLLWAHAGVYAFGAVAPVLSGASWLIQLHLLRVSVVFHLVAAIALAMVLVQPGTPPWRRLLLAPALLTVRPALLLVLLAPLAHRVASRLALRMPAVPARGAVATVATLVVVAQLAPWPGRLAQQEALAASARAWHELARAIGERTPPGSAVMLPLVTDAEPGEAGSGLFEYASSRSVWVDHKRGAAVLWQPTLLPIWRARRDEVAALADLPQRLAYARRRGLAFVVERCDALPPGTVAELRAGRWCALRPGPAPPAG